MSTSFESRLTQSCQDVVALCGAIAGSVWLWDDSRDALQIVVSYRLDPEYVAYGNQVATTDVAKERAPVYRAYRDRLPVEAKGPMRDERFAYFTHEFADRGFETIYALPLVVDDRSLGALALYFEGLLPTDLPDLQLTTVTMAASASIHAYERHLAARVRELEEANAMLDEKVRHLDEVSRMKSDLLGIISHELRTPLTAILGYTDILRKRERDALDTEFLGYIQLSARRLQAVVEDGLTASLIENGHFTLEPERCDLVPLLHSVLATFAPRLVELGLDVRTVGLEAPTFLQCDPRRLAQVLTNLVGNAVKFSPRHGTIEVELRHTPAEVTVLVRDQGPGIPSDQLERVFEKYHQVTTSKKRQHDGVGLGLMIARSIVQAHGGRIGVRSEAGAGSEFYVTLPRETRARGEFPYGPAARRARAYRRKG